ncbi:hypothetical protein S141_14 [Shewanella sp. phage 1/41]|uniref:hypothetical protein n=1 Tax=Shewanella sp. phage 1/41 TaxID=1458861 RepID=UPI0004F84282|nr:hypothetical protein S141_14 [Shewanella sp. phage 1/41]AHK11660.1 hypothetical protein S141_14 [Shewanella sp. phage 1/41]
MRSLNDVGNVGLYSGGTMGAATATASITDVITQNSVLIGITLTAVSIVIGIVFKAIGTYHDIKHKRILEKQDLEYKKYLMSK